MARLTMDDIIHSASYGTETRLIDIDDDSSRIKYYFFFRQELDTAPIASGDVEKDLRDYQELKRTVLRHAIPNKGKMFDYIVGKHYKTLRDWAIANNRSLEDIVYGVNHIHFMQDRTVSWITLDDLLYRLCPDWIWPSENPAQQEAVVPENAVPQNADTNVPNTADNEIQQNANVSHEIPPKHLVQMVRTLLSSIPTILEIVETVLKKIE